jgi:cell division septal protein FtsQ
MPRKPKRSQKDSNRSPGNRTTKGGEQHRLDLAPESPATREIRSQERVRWGFHVAVCVLVLFGLIALGRATVREAFEKNPRFALREVVVNTQGSLTPQKIVKTAGLTDGQNLLSINLREIRERIEQLPEVRSGAIARDYGGKLTIAVEQRRPVAWLESDKLKLHPMTSGGGMLLDKDGVAVPCDVLVKEYVGLPIIRSEGLSAVTPGARIESPQIAAAMKLIAEMKSRSTGARQQIKRIDILSAYALQTRFVDGVEVTFGLDGLDDQLARYRRISSEAHERGWQIATLNLLVEDNIPVTFKNVAAVTDPAPSEKNRDRADLRGSSRRN